MEEADRLTRKDNNGGQPTGVCVSQPPLPRRKHTQEEEECFQHQLHI